MAQRVVASSQLHSRDAASPTLGWPSRAIMPAGSGPELDCQLPSDPNRLFQSRLPREHLRSDRDYPRDNRRKSKCADLKGPSGQPSCSATRRKQWCYHGHTGEQTAPSWTCVVAQGRQCVPFVLFFDGLEFIFHLSSNPVMAAEAIRGSPASCCRICPRKDRFLCERSGGGVDGSGYSVERACNALRTAATMASRSSGFPTTS
jgi:hypothetical protein